MYIYINIYTNHIYIYMVSLVSQLVKNPPSMWETWVQSLIKKAERITG